MAFVTFDEARQYLRLPDSVTTDTVLTQIINSVCAMIETAIGRPIEEASYTDWFVDQYQVKKVVLRMYPVTSITSVEVEGETLSSDAYWVESDIGILHFEEPQSGDIKVVYTAGYATTPEDLKGVALELIRELWIAQQSVAGEPGTKPEDYAERLQKHPIIQKYRKVT